MERKLAFAVSEPFTLGVELELQLINPVNGDLHGAAPLILSATRGTRLGEQIKPEVTQAMLEINSRVHARADTLREDLCYVRDELSEIAQLLGVKIAGGGTHPFQDWRQRTISHSPRFEYVAGLYGYLAQQFTVFGQHIHVGCPSGDAAVRLINQLHPYMPHFIALSAASPFVDGEDTSFACARLNSVSPFPMTGPMPVFDEWIEFESFFLQAKSQGVLGSVKDLYWDIRPKPEYGTLEIRVCDTPLTVEKACSLAAFAQTLSAWLTEHPQDLSAHSEAMYAVNRFRACRFGLFADYIRADGGGTKRLRDHTLALLDDLAPMAKWLGTELDIAALYWQVEHNMSDARWLRQAYARTRSLPASVHEQADLWMNTAIATSVPRIPELVGVQ
jgi:glutamate---cysteine ligase / carboxylate-amine ligase